MDNCGLTAAILLILVCALFGSAQALASESDYDAIADRILQTYKSSWPQLPPDKQKHWALRMYRATGDTSWYPAIRFDLHQTLQASTVDADSLVDSAYYGRRVESLIEAMDWGKRKNHVRRALFVNRSEILLQLNILYNLATLDDYKLADSSVNSVCSRARELIRPEAIVDFLTDTATIVSYGPQAANAIAYLHQLNLIDARREYLAAFRNAFPDSLDRKLDYFQFADKVYGLTHIVIAASGYYQHRVDESEYRWILNYFKQQRRRILEDMSTDIIAEVGLCFLLCGDTSDDTVDRCRKAVVKDFNRKAGLIQSTSGSIDLVTSEHRNIVTYMLLRWPQLLFSGPHL